ncbi:RHS repeat-associated core domain-containing protein [Lysobacter sp. 22409]|uniref:RHS repeat-associated core domain-containing protein n=1 Tax=Lysobacter sp. 22409 TaxID=3453917 RepID=UPI003F86AE09
MAHSALLRFVSLVCATLAILLLPRVSLAADQYCATRYMPGQETACFNTLGEAESYIRTEPSVPIGNALLERAPQEMPGAGSLLYSYKVPRQAIAAFVGDFYKAGSPLGSVRCDTKVPGVVAPDGSTWCDDEASMAERIRRSSAYGDSYPPGFYTGSYDLSTPQQWTVHPSGGYLYVYRNIVGEGRRIFNLQLTPTVTHYWSIDRVDWYRCPPLFAALGDHTTTEHPKWPIVCHNTARATITKKSGQYNSCCKDGNPAVAATGNKEYRETDFDWEGGDFARAYNSIRDLSLQSGLTDNWAHSFSTRLLMVGGWPEAWITSDGYFEYLTWNSTTSSYGSANRPGVVVVKESDEVAALRGRWRISVASEELKWFDDKGRLASFDRSGRAFYLDYCTSADVQSGACLADGDLLRVRSPSGRTLNFAYLAAMTPRVGDNGIRLARVTADGAVLVDYVYDGVGRLTHASKAGASAGEGREYLYAEVAHLCRAANGSVVPGCNAALFPHHLTGVIDENGQRYATYDYDDLGRVTISDHAGGAGKVTLTYDAAGGATVTLPTGSTKAYTFSTEAFRQPTKIAMSVTDGSLAGASTAFYSNNRRQWSQDARNVRTQFTYDHFHEISSKAGLTTGGGTTAFTRTTQTDWRPNYALPTERRVLDNTNALVAKSKWTHNDRGQVLTSTQVDPVTNAERTTTTTYCEAADVAAGGNCPVLGAVKAVDGPRTDVADVSSYSYYASDDPACATSPATCAYRKGDLWKVTDALGHATEFLRYDVAGRALSSKDANGVVTDLEYTPRGWLAARKVRGANNGSEADDAITRMEYDLIGQVKKVIQPDGMFVRYEYDAAHRLTDIYDNAGNRIHYTLDSAGNRTKEDTNDSNGALMRTLSRVYNQLGQLKTAKTAQGHATGFSYDANGNGDITTDALGRKTDNDYDPLDRLAKTLQDVGGINAKIEYKYDALDRVTQVTDPKGLSTTYSYNGLGDQVQLSSPDTGVTNFSYNAAGQVATKQDANDANPHVYTYDAVGRPKTVSYGSGNADVEYDYDTVNSVCAAGETFAVGRVIAMRTEGTELKYCYDRFGRVVRKVQSVDSQSFTLRYAYTLAGQLQALTYPDGAVADYVRDNQGRVTEIGVTPAGGVRSVLLNNASYKPFGPVAGWTYGNGRNLQRTYDQDYRPKSIFDAASGGLSLSYGYNEVGELTQLKDGLQSAALAQYDYDALGRLKVTRDGPTGTPLETYGYDATGNRTSLLHAGITTDYSYPSTSHRLSNVGGVSRSFDAVGNTTSIGDTAREFVYNANDRMSQVKQAGVVKTSYRYNAKGQLVSRADNATGVITGYTLYDEAGHWLGDYDANGATKQQAIWLGDAPVGLVVGAGVAQTLRYVQPDHLGTPRVVIDPSRNLAVWSWDAKSEAFGNNPPNQDPDQDGIAFVFDMRFLGQSFDAATGLNYNYFRNYDATTGRYVQSDPIGQAGGLGTFVYANAKPLEYMDRLGLSPHLVATAMLEGLVAGCISGCVGAVVGDFTKCVAKGVWQRRDIGRDSLNQCSSECTPDPCSALKACATGCLVGGLIGAGTGGTGVTLSGVGGFLSNLLLETYLEALLPVDLCQRFGMKSPGKPNSLRIP